MAVSLFDAFINIKGDISGFQSSMTQAKSLANSSGSAISSGFSKLAGIASLAWGAATTAVTAFAKSAVSAGLTFDAAMGQVAATQGKELKDLNDEIGSVNTAYGEFNGTLRDFAKFMGRNTQFTATQAAQALNYMALAGYETADSMQMLPAVLDMASAGTMDLARASDMITDTQKALGLDIERTKVMVNEFAKAAASGNTSVEQLGDAFLTVGGLAKEANGGLITLKDGTTDTVDGVQMLEAAFTAMADAGIKGSEAGTHMRNILLKLANPTKGGQEALDAMGVSIYDATGKMKPLNQLFNELNTALSQLSQQEKLSYLGEIFNARDTASAEALLAAASDGHWNELAKTIKYAGDSASEMAKTKLENLQGDITKFKSAMEGLRISISDGVNPALRSFVQLGTTGISKITDALEKGDFSGAMDVVGNMINEGLSKVFDYAGPLLEAGGKIVAALAKGIVENIPKLLTAAKTLIINFVTGLDPASVVGGITEFIQSIADVLSDGVALSKIAEAGIKVAAALAEGIMNSIGIFENTEANIISGLVGGFVRTLPTVLPQLIKGIQNLITTLLEASKSRLESIEEIASVIYKAGVELIVTLANGIASALPELIPAVISTIAYVAEQLLSADNISKIMNAALNLITQLGWGLVAAIPQLLEAAIEIILNLCEYLVNPANLAQIINTALQLIIQLAVGLISALPVLLGEIPNIIVSIFGALWDGIVHTDWLELGKQILTGLVRGLWAALTSVLDAVGDICSNIYGKIKNFFGISSPSKLMRNKVGMNIALGLAEGLEDGTSNVEKAMEDIMSTATGEINGTVTARSNEMDINHTGTIRIEGVNNQGEFVAASEYAIEEIITNIMKREARLA